MDPVPAPVTPVRPRASIVIPVWNEAPVTLRCLESLVASTPEDLFEVVIVDNGSSDDTPALLAGLGGDVRVITNAENVGYTLASNQGARASTGEVVVFLNNDTEPQPGWLEALLGCLDEHPEAAIAGAKLVYPDGRLQEAGGLVFRDGSGWNFGRLANPFEPRFEIPCEVDYCSGAALAVRRTFLDEVGGGYDERFAPAYYEDTDLCFAARAAGFTVRFVPESIVVHHEGVTAGTDLGSGYKRYQERNRSIFIEKWRSVLAAHEPPPMQTGWRPTTADRSLRTASVSQVRVPLVPVRPSPKVLVIDPFLPLHDRASGSLRLFRLVELFREQGCQVTFLARYAEGQDRYRRDLEGLGVRVLGSDPERLEDLGAARISAPRIDLPALLGDEEFDLAWISFADVALQYLPWIRRHSPTTHVIIDSVDVHHVRERRRAELASAAGASDAPELLARSVQTRHREAWAYALADQVIAVTDQDRIEILELAPAASVSLVPNIHAPAEHPATPDGRSGMLFVGNFAHTPNVDAVEWLCLEVMPRVRAEAPDAMCRIVGAGMPDALARLVAATPGVDALGWVPDLAPFIASARVSIAPLRYGAGMKGKVAEALGEGLPVVTTSIGAEGMGLVDGVHVRVADDPDRFAAGVLEVLSDDVLWHRLSQSGREVIDRQYSPDAVRPAVAGILGSGLDRSRVGVA